MPEQFVLRRETNLYDDDAIAKVNDKVIAKYATCTTASSVVAKIATIDDDFVLYKGARISVYFANANTATTPTLNVNNTGAKEIWAYGGALSTGGNTFNWVANSTIEFVYDGSHWLVADSSAAGLISKYDEKLNQEVIFNKLTNNGTARGIFLDANTNQLYINMDYLQTGTLVLGRAGNVSGTMIVEDVYGNQIGKWDKDGIMAIGVFESKYNWRYDPGPGGTPRDVVTKTLLDSGCIYFYGDEGDTYARGVVGLNDVLRPGYGGFSNPTTAPFYISVEYNGAIEFARRTGANSNAYSALIVFDATHSPQINSSSSKRYKHDITDKIDDELDAHRLYNLKMKQFVFNEDHDPQYKDMIGKTIPGFIAEDVAEIYPAAVIYDWQNLENIESWDERRIIPGMLALIQEQNEKIKRLEKKLCM